MSVREDREDFQNTGLQGLVRKLMRETEEGFVRVHSGELSGEIVSMRPKLGSGAYVHTKRGQPPMMHRNGADMDDSAVEFRLVD